MKAYRKKYLSKMKIKQDDFDAKIIFRYLVIILLISTLNIIPFLISNGFFGDIDTTFTFLCGKDVEECMKHDAERKQKNLFVIGSLIGIYTIISSQVITNLYEILTYKNKSENIKKYISMLKIVVALCTIYLLMYSYKYSSPKVDRLTSHLNEPLDNILNLFSLGIIIHTCWLLLKRE
ncbi:hypothetical protein ACMGE5_10165 [Macrococcus equi]|uniref:hypothetical protein n=1 Tax=Macrococcus equi TaxID=3395462 RepID=UPI0039BE21A3